LTHARTTAERAPSTPPISNHHSPYKNLQKHTPAHPRPHLQTGVGPLSAPPPPDPRTDTSTLSATPAGHKNPLLRQISKDARQQVQGHTFYPRPGRKRKTRRPTTEIRPRQPPKLSSQVPTKKPAYILLPTTAKALQGTAGHQNTYSKAHSQAVTLGCQGARSSEQGQYT